MTPSLVEKLALNVLHRPQPGTEFFPRPLGWFGERLLVADVQLSGEGMLCVSRIPRIPVDFIQGRVVGPCGHQSSARLALNPNLAWVGLPRPGCAFRQQSGSLGLKSCVASGSLLAASGGLQ